MRCNWDLNNVSWTLQQAKKLAKTAAAAIKAQQFGYAVITTTKP
jgi:hypothetical protein